MAKKAAGKTKKTWKAGSKKTVAKKTWGKGAPRATIQAKTIVRPEKVRNAARPKNGSTMSYTYSEFLENVKGFCGLVRRSEAKELCEDLASFIRDSLRRGYKIPLLGLGKLYVRQSKARQGRNPQTGEVVQIPARKRVRFTAAKALKEAVL